MYMGTVFRIIGFSIVHNKGSYLDSDERDISKLSIIELLNRDGERGINKLKKQKNKYAK